MDNKPVLDIDIDISIHLSYFIDGGGGVPRKLH